MAYKILESDDNKFIGNVLDYIEKGQIITFSDGTVLPITKVFKEDDGKTLIVFSANYKMTMVKE